MKRRRVAVTEIDFTVNRLSHEGEASSSENRYNNPHAPPPSQQQQQQQRQPPRPPQSPSPLKTSCVAVCQQLGAPRGRGLVTCQRVPAGTRVVSELPVVHWVTHAWRDIACANCLLLKNETADFTQPLTPWQRGCTHCGQAHWCSAACQSNDAARHATSCGFWASLDVQGRSSSGSSGGGSDSAKLKLKGNTALARQQKKSTDRINAAADIDVDVAATLRDRKSAKKRSRDVNLPRGTQDRRGLHREPEPRPPTSKKSSNPPVLIPYKPAPVPREL